MNDSLMWFLLFIVFITIEVISPGIILIFFAFGALVTSILEIFIDLPLGFEIGVFAISSIASLTTLRGKIKEALNMRYSKFLPADEYIGKKVIVKEKIIEGGLGRVELHGTDWNAISEDEMETGEEVIIIERDNLTFKVAKIDN
jgi:membrane protein implicated in regulation of membrane protease activity